MQKLLLSGTPSRHGIKTQAAGVSSQPRDAGKCGRIGGKQRPLLAAVAWVKLRAGRSTGSIRG